MVRFFAAVLFGVGLLCGAAAQGGVVMVPIIVPQVQTLPATRGGNYTAIHALAVLSAIGQSLTVQRASLLVPSARSIDIHSWKLDDQVEAFLDQYLRPRFAIKKFDIDRAALAQIPNGVWNYSLPAVRKILSAVPSDGLDAFIIVRPDLESQTPGLAGLALQDRNDGVLISNSLPLGWANYEIDVIDAHTLAVIAKAYSRVQLRAGVAPTFAAITFSKDVFPSGDFSFSGRQLEILQGGFSKLVNISLLETMRALNLGVTVPEVGSRSLVPIPADKDPYASIETIAVASAIGDQLRFEHLGGTFLSQSHETMPIDNWNIDREIEAAARSTLSKRFSIKDVSVDRTQLLSARLVDSDGKTSPSFPGLRSTAQVDAYVLFVKHPISLWTRVDPSGIGVWNHTPILDLPRINAVYANYAVAVVDAHTLKLIAAGPGMVGPAYATPNPVLDIDWSLWPEHVASLKPAQGEAIHAALSRLIGDTVPETLLHMGLTGMMVSSGPSLTTPAQQ